MKPSGDVSLNRMANERSRREWPGPGQHTWCPASSPPRTCAILRKSIRVTQNDGSFCPLERDIVVTYIKVRWRRAAAVGGNPTRPHRNLHADCICAIAPKVDLCRKQDEFFSNPVVQFITVPLCNRICIGLVENKTFL